MMIMSDPSKKNKTGLSQKGRTSFWGDFLLRQLLIFILMFDKSLKNKQTKKTSHGTISEND